MSFSLPRATWDLTVPRGISTCDNIISLATTKSCVPEYLAFYSCIVPFTTVDNMQCGVNNDNVHDIDVNSLCPPESNALITCISN